MTRPVRIIILISLVFVLKVVSSCIHPVYEFCLDAGICLTWLEPA